MRETTGSEHAAASILEYIQADTSKGAAHTLDLLSALAGDESEHTSRMREIFGYLEKLGIASRFTIDPSITRGLDYYTGIVYETFLDDLPQIGSICSGGRYNDLASLYTKEHLPGVGSSIGLDRLLAALEELGNPLFTDASGSDVIIFNQDVASQDRYHLLANRLRGEGIRCDVYLTQKKLPAQFKYADLNGIPFGIIMSEEDLQAGTCTLRRLATREDIGNLTFESLLSHLKRNKTDC